LTGRTGLTLADILTFPFCFVGRVPHRIMGPLAAARETAQQLGGTYPAFPAAVVESPVTALLAVRASDAIVAVTGSLAAPLLRSGEITLLPWHEPWFATNFGIVHLRTRPPSATATMFIECLRQADRETEADDARLLASIAASEMGTAETAYVQGVRGRSAEVVMDLPAAAAPRHWVRAWGSAPRSR
jgi:DNA-binding transcriptional LysR family regulator